MTLPFVAVVKALTETVDATTKAVTYSFGAGTSIACDIQPLPAETAVFSDRTGVQLGSPHLLLTTVANAGSLGVGNRVEYDSRFFAIETKVRKHQFGNATDHCVSIIEELEKAS